MSHSLRVSLAATSRTRGDIHMGHHDLALYEEIAALDPRAPWTPLPPNNGIKMDITTTTTATAAFATWHAALQGGGRVHDEDEVDEDGDAAAMEMAGYLRSEKAAAVCRKIMTASEKDNADALGLPLPVGEIRTEAAARKFIVMQNPEWKSSDFQAMADTWNNDIFVSIANAVKSGTDLPAIFFTDRVSSWIAVVWVLSL